MNLTSPSTRPKRRNPPATYGMRLQGEEWQVQHGNKIVARYTGDGALDVAEDHLRRLLNKGKKGATS